MKVLLVIAGALVGMSLASSGHVLFGLGIGAAVALLFNGLTTLRKQVTELELRLYKAERSRPTASTAPAPIAPRDVAADPAREAAPDVVAQRSTPPSAASPSPPPPPPPPPSPTPVGQPAAAAAQSRHAPISPSEPVVVHVAQPARESFLVGAIRAYFTGGNTLVRVGVVVLFLGVAFLLRYVAEHSNIPMEVRLTGVALGAIVMLVVGWRLRAARPGYALAMQGGAVAILYLTVFVALRLYALLPASLAFLLLVAITAFATVLAVAQNSMAFAIFAFAGGFLAPVLTSTGQGNHVVLFSYYVVLNAGIVAIAWFKAWRPLVLVGFLFTFVIATAWGVLRYQDAFFSSTEPFLVVFFLFYVALAVLFALRQAPDLKGYVDGTIVFGTPVAAFGLQSGMLDDQRYLLAFSALGIGVLYIGLAAVLWRRHRNSLRLLVESFVALGVAFATLAVPLALDGRWTAATWALEGAALVWVGCRQNRRLPRAAGILLQLGAGIIFWRDMQLAPPGLPLLNNGFLGGAMVALAAILSTLKLARVRDKLADYEQVAVPLVFVWGVVWWLVAGLLEIDRQVPAPFELAAALLFLALSAWLFHWLRHARALEMARWPALALPIGMLSILLLLLGESGHPFGAGGWLAWPVAFAVQYFLLRWNADVNDDGNDDALICQMLHMATAWLLVSVLTFEAVWQVGHWVGEGLAWQSVTWVLLPLGALWLLPLMLAQITWPLQRHARTYKLFYGGGVALYIASWLLSANMSDTGNAHPLPYVPLLNPLDIVSGLSVLALVRYWLWLRRTEVALAKELDARVVHGMLATLGFVWLNGALLRAIHHLVGVPYTAEALLRSTIVQVSLSIFWTLIALGAMLIATRKANRPIWLVGAGLLAVVIVKLFLVDLSRIGSIERIVSFVVVGLLILIVGYFSPLPPERAGAAPTPERS
ncbi:MAG: DUF2339 domain-containing protein [Steroidobacteraceae bacterium]